MSVDILRSLLSQKYVTLIDVFDILITTFIIYKLLLILRGTRAYQLLRGMFILFGIYLLTHFLGFYTIDWLMQNLITFIFIILIVVFQPELRNILEKLGRNKYIANLFAEDEKPKTGSLKHIIKSIIYLAENKCGTLIVIERQTGLQEYTESGIILDAQLNSELLTTIFSTKNPLHDGAVIIEDSKIKAAGCLLPLTENRILDRRLGTRHRAAIGLSEQSDAVILVVSEETGVISIAENGTLTRYLSKENLEERLFNSFNPPSKGHEAPKILKQEEQE